VPELAEWESFYVIVGGGAAALIGLQFVVLTLIAEKPQLASPEAGAAFATPTIVHFSSALALAAGLRIPWESTGPVAVLLGIAGIAGMGYTAMVARRARRHDGRRARSTATARLDTAVLKCTDACRVCARVVGVVDGHGHAAFCRVNCRAAAQQRGVEGCQGFIFQQRILADRSSRAIIVLDVPDNVVGVVDLGRWRSISKPAKT